MRRPHLSRRRSRGDEVEHRPAPAAPAPSDDARDAHRLGTVLTSSDAGDGRSSGTDVDGSAWARRMDRLLSVQRPVVLRHVAALRRRHPKADPERIVRLLEREYLTAVTTGGAAVGASAVIPGVGWGVSLALSGVETAGFLEASALFAQSVAEVHGIVVSDPDRARTLVMAMILGAPGAALVRQLAGEAVGTAPARQAFWGELVTSQVPKAALSNLTGPLKKSFLRRFAASQGTSALGRAVPFGVGAVVGGVGNHTLGRKVVTAAREAFGPAPAAWPLVLDD